MNIFTAIETVRSLKALSCSLVVLFILFIFPNITVHDTSNVLELNAFIVLEKRNILKINLTIVCPCI